MNDPDREIIGGRFALAASRMNGAPAPTVFPLGSFREAAIHLRRPFTQAAVKFKVQATWPKDKPTGGLIVAYIDARLAVERLNLIVPHLWSDEYELAGKGGLICHLTVDGITRRDLGEGVGKGLFSDALKRAAVKFGVGVSLYAIPKMTLNFSDGHLKPRRTRDGESLELTPAGEKRVRATYAAWLTEIGVQAFGEPLDHGDTEGAQGDVEADGEDQTPSPEPERQSATAAPTSQPTSQGALPAEVVHELLGVIKQARMPMDWLRMQLAAVGLQNVPDGPLLRSTLEALTGQQADALSVLCRDVVEAREHAEREQAARERNDAVKA